MKADDGLADLALFPRGRGTVIGQRDACGMEFAVPEIELKRVNLDLAANGRFEIAHQLFLQARDLPPAIPTRRRDDQHDGEENSQDQAETGATHP